MTVTIHRATYSVRRPRASETPALGMLLPAVPPGGPEPEFRVAVAHGSPAIIGAAVMIPRLWGRRVPGFRVALRVPLPFRRQGVGRALVEALTEEARRHGAPALRAWEPVVDGSGEAAFLAALGFVPVRRILHFETDFSGAHSAARRVRRRLEAAGKVPAAARLVPLEAADSEAVLSLHQKNLGGERELLARRLAGEMPGGWSRELSTVLMLGDELCGALLLALDEALVRVDALIVDARLRDRWAPAVLIAGGFDRVVLAGVRVIRFFCHDDVSDTLKLARRCGAEPRKVEMLFARRLQTAAARSCPAEDLE